MTTKVFGSLDDFTPFFGGDHKGHQMVHALFDGTEYTNRSKEPSPLLKQLLRAENYTRFQSYRNNATGQSMLPEDVHHNVADLVITAALFAHKIDKPSKAGTKYGLIYNRVTTSLNNFLNKVNSSHDKFAEKTSSMGKFAPSVVYKLQDKDYGHILLYTLADRALYSVASGNKSVDDNGLTEAMLLDTLVNCDNNTNNICWGTVFNDTAGINTGVNDAITDLISLTHGVNKKDAISVIQRTLRVVLHNLIENMKMEMIKRYGNEVYRDTRKTVNGIIGTYNKVTVADFMDELTYNSYREMLTNSVRTEVENAIGRYIATKVNITHTTLSTNEAKTFTDTVFKNWETMGVEAHSFYQQNIALFAKATSDLYDHSIRDRDQTIKDLDWIRLTNKEIEDIFKRSVTPDVANLRVNFMKRKDGNGAGEVLFGTNLPDFPEKTNLWYSQLNGFFGVVPNPGTDFLRRLYDAVYTSGNGNVLGLTSVENDVNKRPKGAFDLDFSKFTTNYLNSKDPKVHTPSVHDESNIFADYPLVKGIHAVDMAYNRTWTYDAQHGEYYRMENGRKVWYNDQAKGDSKTCYASYLGGKDGKECRRVIECLFDGKPDTLARCMDVLDSANMWDIAKEDALKVGPEMVRAVLSRFGVKGRTANDANGSIKVPMAYEEWMRDVVEKEFPENVRDTIKKNTKLTDYIKGLINTCRTNPSILNKNNPHVVAREDTPQFAKDLSLQKYSLPEVNSDNVFKLFSGSLEHATMPRVVNNDLWNVFLSGSMSNVGFFSPYADQFSNIMGGGFYKQQGGVTGAMAITPGLPSTSTSNMNLARNSRLAKGNGSSNMFNSLFAVLTRAMADVGIQIHSEDMDRIREAINKINQYEKELGLLCDILQSIVKLARFHGVSLENIDRDNVRVVKLSKLNDFEDVRDFVRCYVRDITRNMANNMSIQQYTGYELMSKLAPRYCDSVSGDDSQKSKCATYSDSKDLVPL